MSVVSLTAGRARPPGAPTSVNPSAMAKVTGLARSIRSSSATQMPSEAICAMAMSMKMMPRWTTCSPRYTSSQGRSTQATLGQNITSHMAQEVWKTFNVQRSTSNAQRMRT